MNSKNAGMAATRLIILFLLVALSVSTDAEAEDGSPIAYPGSSWGKLTRDGNRISGDVTMWNFTQGIDWYRFSNDITLNTFFRYSQRLRTLNTRFYNEEGPTVGIKLKKGPVSYGFEYFEEYFPELNTTSINREFFSKGFFDWALGKTAGAFKYPGSSWFFANYDLTGLTGSGLMGYVRQGIELYRFPQNITFTAYAEYYYRGRTKQRKYYDSNGPMVGFELAQSPFNLGIDYFWETFPALHQSSQRIQIYIGWYTSWKL